MKRATQASHWTRRHLLLAVLCPLGLLVALLAVQTVSDRRNEREMVKQHNEQLAAYQERHRAAMRDAELPCDAFEQLLARAGPPTTPFDCSRELASSSLRSKDIARQRDGQQLRDQVSSVLAILARQEPRACVRSLIDVFAFLRAKSQTGGLVVWRETQSILLTAERLALRCVERGPVGADAVPVEVLTSECAAPPSSIAPSEWELLSSANEMQMFYRKRPLPGLAWYFGRRDALMNPPLVMAVWRDLLNDVTEVARIGHGAAYPDLGTSLGKLVEDASRRQAEVAPFGAYGLAKAKLVESDMYDVALYRSVLCAISKAQAGEASACPSACKDPYSGLELAGGRRDGKLQVFSTGPNRENDQLSGDDVGVEFVIGR